MYFRDRTHRMPLSRSTFFKWHVPELAIMVLLLAVIQFGLGHSEERIKADGAGHFDYLPSIFLHHDFIRKDVLRDDDWDLYGRTETLGGYADYKGRTVNKYPIGTALLQSPFFAATCLFADADVLKQNLKGPLFQWAVFFAALFYLFLGLIFYRKLLAQFDIDPLTIFTTQSFLVFATGLVHYVSDDPAYGHVYSFSAITAFLYFSKRFFQDRGLRDFLWMSALLGLIFLLRNPNLLIVLALPFIAGNRENFKAGVREVFTSMRLFFGGLFLFCAIGFIQLLAWYLQTGDWLVYSYQGEGFDFLHPHFLDILFSYKKGLFVYTPILLFALVALFQWGRKKRWFLLFTWSFFFVVLTYILSSWWSWYYGGSFGLRTYIDFYSLFFLAFAMVFSGWKKFFKVATIGVGTILVWLTLVQTYQYQNYILHWFEMDKESYWMVFLEMDDAFRGLLWTEDEDDSYRTVSTTDLLEVNDRSEDLILLHCKLDELPEMIDAKEVVIHFNAHIAKANRSKILLNVIEGNKVHYWLEVPVIHFQTEGLDIEQKGTYVYRLPNSDFPANAEMNVIFKADAGVITLSDTRLSIKR